MLGLSRTAATAAAVALACALLVAGGGLAFWRGMAAIERMTDRRHSGFSHWSGADCQRGGAVRTWIVWNGPRYVLLQEFRPPVSCSPPSATGALDVRGSSAPDDP
jgi:hypothetical protein